jgi:hypothetical protein
VESGTESIPDPGGVVHPAWRPRDRQIRSGSGPRPRGLATLGAQSWEAERSDTAVTSEPQKQAQLQEPLEPLGPPIEQLPQQRNPTPPPVRVAELPDGEHCQRLLPERTQFLDTLQLIRSRAATSRASALREARTRRDDTRALLRQPYNPEADLFPDAESKTLTVCLPHLTQAVQDQALRHLGDEVNATETISPGTDLRLIYTIGSC